MKFELIDMKTWKRAEYLSHYLNNVKNVVSMTVDIDVTRLLCQTKKSGYRFFPAFLYAVSKVVNRHEEFRMGYSSEGKVGIWDEVCPSYIILHSEVETLTRIFTPWQDDLRLFAQAVTPIWTSLRPFGGSRLMGCRPIYLMYPACLGFTIAPLISMCLMREPIWRLSSLGGSMRMTARGR